ncbi:replication factor C subunit 2/4 [Enteropsectra breve]|nr:replication factor C subunit 2/4 [Enteropsectra breve]
MILFQFPFIDIPFTDIPFINIPFINISFIGIPFIDSFFIDSSLVDISIHKKFIYKCPIMLLVDKYKPTSIQNILGNKDITGILESLDDSFPHMLLTGPPGTGKTTAAHILKAGRGCPCLELNASDERGIDTVRTRIKNFCAISQENKLVILDECDSLTTAAQQALRRIMEMTDTRFILICNQMSKIIEPIQSRCAVLKFSRVAISEFIGRLREICAAEAINLSDEAYSALIDLSSGDMRSCLNCLEGVSALCASDPSRVIDAEFIYRVNGSPNYGRIKKILKDVISRNTEAATEAFEALWAEKYEPSDLMNGFFRAGKEIEDYEALRVIGRYHIRIIEGTESKAQFYGLFSELMDLYS